MVFCPDSALEFHLFPGCPYRLALQGFRLAVILAEGVYRHLNHGLILIRAVHAIALDVYNPLYLVKALDDLAKRRVLAVQMRRVRRHDKELGAPVVCFSGFSNPFLENSPLMR